MMIIVSYHCYDDDNESPASMITVSVTLMPNCIPPDLSRFRPCPRTCTAVWPFATWVCLNMGDTMGYRDTHNLYLNIIGMPWITVEKIWSPSGFFGVFPRSPDKSHPKSSQRWHCLLSFTFAFRKSESTTSHFGTWIRSRDRWSCHNIRSDLLKGGAGFCWADLRSKSQTQGPRSSCHVFFSCDFMCTITYYHYHSLSI